MPVDADQQPGHNWVWPALVLSRLPGLLHVAKVRRVDFSPDEWIAGTVRLSNAERGLYITACALIYSHGGPIEFDHLRAACIDHGHAFKRQFERLVGLGKLTVNDGQIANKRALNELQNADKRMANARQNGRKGGRPPNPVNGIENPGLVGVEKLTINHQPSTINHQIGSVPNGTAGEAPAADPVAEIFDRGLAVLGGPTSAHRSLLGKLRKEHGDPAVLEAIVACEAELPSEPASFLMACLARAGPKARRQRQTQGEAHDAETRAFEFITRPGYRGNGSASFVALLDNNGIERGGEAADGTGLGRRPRGVRPVDC